MSEEYPYNGRLSRWEEAAPGLAIVGVQSLEEPFPFEPGQYATLGLVGPEGKLVQRPMNIKGPKGRFLLQDDGRSCLFVASGTGLAPFMSMICTLHGRGESRDIVLLHGVSYDHDLGWREHLTSVAADGFPLRYLGTVSRPQHSPGWDGLTGRVEAITEAQLDEQGLTADNATIYLCGNPEMIVAVDEIALGRGFTPEQIRKELYWPKGRAH